MNTRPIDRSKLIIAFAAMYPLAAFGLNEAFPIIACFPNLLPRGDMALQWAARIFYVLFFWGPGFGALVLLPYTGRKLVWAMLTYLITVVPLSLAFGFVLLLFSTGPTCADVVAEWRARGY